MGLYPLVHDCLGPERFGFAVVSAHGRRAPDLAL